MKKILFTILMSLSASNCFANFDFTGSYECQGYDPYLKTKYTGVIIIKQQKTVYSVKMAYSTGEEANGTAGLYDDNTIAVVFQDTKDLKKVGLERYSLSEDENQIEGYWVYLGGDQLGTEICKKMK